MPDFTRILLVDDRPENLLSLEAILEPLCAQTEAVLVRASSGEQALKELLENDFALILLDVQMPGMDGFETASLIKERPRSRHIPIIFVTALNTDHRYVFKGYSAGAVDYIAKPLDPDILKSKVAVFIELYQKNLQVRAQAELLRKAQEREAARRLAEREHQWEQRHLAELAESEARLSRFKETLDATLDCVFIFDAHSLKFTYVNRGAMQQFGYSCDELLAMTPLDLEEIFDEREFRVLVAPLVRGRREWLLFEKIARRKDGSQVPVEVFLQYMAPEGDSARFIAIVRDITARKKMEASLIQAKEQAEAASRAKSDFLSGVSHELRTPLNAIIGFSKLLLNPRVGPLNESQTVYAQDVVQSAEHLLQLINDILDLSKIEAGKLTLDCAPICLADILAGSMTIIRERASRHRLQLKLEIAPEVSNLPPVMGDARKIKQILYNLLSNAAKFTPDGGSITLRAALRSEAENPSSDADGKASKKCTVEIAVIDTGIGIAPEDQERIFANFEQVDHSYSKKQQGTGLGLAICRQLSSLHGGQVKVESVLGQGSTFTLVLPLCVQDESEERGGEEKATQSTRASGEASVENGKPEKEFKVKKPNKVKEPEAMPVSPAEEITVVQRVGTA